MRRKKYIYITIVVFVITLCAGILLTVIMNWRADTKNVSALPNKTDESIINTNCKNIFVLNCDTDSANDEFIVMLSVNGDVSLCRYSLTLEYDPSILQLIDYDEELSVLSPVVFPGKNEDGDVILNDAQGYINLEWASANNVTKQADIAKFKFKTHKDNMTESEIKLNVKATNHIIDNELVDVEHSIKNAAIKIG